MTIIDYAVIILGDAKVGKTCIIRRFIKGTFTDQYIATVEDVYTQRISDNKKLCVMKIYDTAGSYQFPAMRSLSIKKADAIILVYSIDSLESLKTCERLHDEIKEIKSTQISQTPILLVGNKSDITEAEIKVKSIDAEILARRMRVGFIQTSAKKNRNVDEMFQKLLRMDVKHRLSININKHVNSRSFPCIIS
ncbi:Distinct subgroup of the Ras family member 1 [Intoshia linei]|uniref:Distinct subgroup of the Ras family member 1 n=1 Tax=Intoshia linei TaxID=1819745 RepID=A0A177B444_9BILA|nr:Distinct subgroup of the Ras family member 1 [Intoshia linei]